MIQTNQASEMKGNMKYYAITYQVFGLPMDLTFNVKASSEEEAIERFRRDNKNRILSIKEELKDSNTIYASTED